LIVIGIVVPFCGVLALLGWQMLRQRKLVVPEDLEKAPPPVAKPMPRIEEPRQVIKKVVEAKIKKGPSGYDRRRDRRVVRSALAQACRLARLQIRRGMTIDQLETLLDSTLIRSKRPLPVASPVRVSIPERMAA
ncbi:MAG: hypothetical protein Q8R16_04225, partial [bacterium]|nr:hypothetical protein [bacterium]